MGYSHDMSKEKDKKQLLSEGWRKFQIVDCDEQVSKQGNEMFKFQFMDVETEQVEDVYAIATQGKRWFLKQVLTACDVEARKDGIYEWELADVFNKFVLGRVEHVEEEWINRQGNTILTKKHKIVEVQTFVENG